MKRLAVYLAVALCVCVAVSATAQRKSRRSASKGSAVGQVAKPKAENQFICVEDFKGAKRAPKVAVSVEGYIVTGFRLPDGSYRLKLVDSVDHVLNAKDAEAFARGGASVSVPGSLVRSKGRLAWTVKGMKTWVMYTGPGTAEKQLHDVVPKVRITGSTAPGRAVIRPVTGFEYMDDSGDWKKV